MATIIFDKKKRISDDLYGLFLEDVNHSIDGGLNANQIRNPYFYMLSAEPVEKTLLEKIKTLRQDKKKNRKYHEINHPLYGWNFSRPEDIELYRDRPIFHIRKGEAVLTNDGFDGVGIRCGHIYTLSFEVVRACFDGTLRIFLASDGEKVTNVCTTDAAGTGAYSFTFRAEKTTAATLVVEFRGKGNLQFDRFDFSDNDSFDFNGQNPYGGKMRRDLVEALEELRPSFLRFPGGCIVEGYSESNAYCWKDTVGKLKERKPKPDLWAEACPDRVLMQNYEIGFYEYFLLAEHLHAKPLPILNAGMICQARSDAKTNERFLDKCTDDILDLLEYANGESGFWATKRKESGHEKPFNVDMIGVGNENYGEIYFRNFRYVYDKVRAKYPDIKIVFTNGFKCSNTDSQSYDGNRKLFDGKFTNLVSDDHAYRPPDWMIEHAHLYDSYDRNNYPVFLGEYAANGKDKNITVSNSFRSALSEAAFMTGLERNGDIVVMSSFAPLFSRYENEQWAHNMINFDSLCVIKTATYYNQWLFSAHVGKYSIPVEGADKDLFVSLTEDETVYYLKIINVAREKKNFACELNGRCTHIYLQSDEDNINNGRIAVGQPNEIIAPTYAKCSLQSTQPIEILPRSVNLFVVKK